LERKGISTIGISILRKISESLKSPRTYHLKYPFGHAMGEAFNRPQQKKIFRDCLEVLQTAKEPGIIVDSPYLWKVDKFE